MPIGAFHVHVVLLVMGIVGFATSSAVAESAITDRGEFPLKVVELVCPADNAGTLELTSKSSLDTSWRRTAPIF